MNKFLICLTLLLLSTSALAGWTKVGRDRAEGASVYVDLTTVVRSGQMVTVWTVDDMDSLHILNGLEFLSFKFKEEHNCENGHKRLLQRALMSGHMGGGETLFSTDEVGEWMSSQPGSIGESKARVICGKPIK